MSKIKNIIFVVMIVVLAILSFRAYKSYVDMNKFVKDETAVLNTVCVEQNKNIYCVTPSEIATIKDFISTEFPNEVKDFTNKLPKK